MVQLRYRQFFKHSLAISTGLASLFTQTSCQFTNPLSSSSINGLAQSVSEVHGPSANPAAGHFPSPTPIHVVSPIIPVPSATPTPASTTEPASYSAPIVIDHGGTYTGNWMSMNMDVPAVKVATSEPVIIQNCHIAGNGDGIWSPWSMANITVRNCSFHGRAPNVDNRERGRAISIPMYKNLIVENNYFENTGSVVSTDLYSGNGTTETLIIRFNRVRNIDGRFRNGTGRQLVNFVQQMNYTQAQGNPGGAEIAWNDVINLPDESSTEDLINFYQAGGRANSPFKVHDNFLKGSYPNPSTNSEATGSGIQIDGKDHNRTAYIEVYQNTVMDTLNGGMGMAAGSNVRMHHNRIISSGKFPNGSWMPGNFAGVWIFDYYGSSAVGTMHDNAIDNNVIGWANPNYTKPYANRLDWYSNLGNGIQNNIQLPDSPITLQMEADEYQTFLQKVEASHIKIGPQRP